jgi:cysteine sulfinate desulfinase/cysteine desulfurase-like protein
LSLNNARIIADAAGHECALPVAQGSIRFSLGRYNTEEEIETTLSVLPAIIAKLAEMSPYQETQTPEGSLTGFTC